MGEFKDQNFKNQIGISATVEREQAKGELMRDANEKLKQLGYDISPIKGLKYIGSGAVHVYWNENLRQVAFISQTGTMSEVPEALAQAATKDFIGSLMAMFGQRRPKLRSGF